MQWIKQRKDIKQVSNAAITVRKSGIRFNAIMCKWYELYEGQFVEIFLTDDKKSLGFSFSEVATPDSYTLTADGGGGKGASGLFVACGKMLRATGIPTDKKEPMLILEDKKTGFLYVHLLPEFNHSVDIRPPVYDELGVYRYIFDNDIVYIGQGRIKDRIGDKQRESWQFDKIEYTILETPEECIKFESSLLDEFRQLNGKLPFYNRIGGKVG
jgi:hypothetical protein